MAYPWARRGALLAVFLGLFAFFETQLVLAGDQHMGNIQKLCSAGAGSRFNPHSLDGILDRRGFRQEMRQR